MKVYTPEQLEDADVADVIANVIAMRQKAEKRQALNYIRSQLEPELTQARLDGREIDIVKLNIRAVQLLDEFHARN